MRNFNNLENQYVEMYEVRNALSLLNAYLALVKIDKEKYLPLLEKWVEHTKKLLDDLNKKDNKN